MKHLFYISLLLALYGCQDQHMVQKLSPELSEISGLSYSDQYGLWCVHDETGYIYQLDTSTFEVTQKIRISDSHDFEGIEILNDNAYVVSSNGDIFEFNFNTSISNVKKTKLKHRHNVEGLGKDEEHGLLLLGLKDDPLKKSDKKKKLDHILTYDPVKDKIIKEPNLTISYKEIESMGKGKVKNRLGISGLARHLGKTYILSHRNKFLLIYNQSGKLEQVKKLDPSIYYQPEGITVMESTLIISNEGNLNMYPSLILHEI